VAPGKLSKIIFKKHKQEKKSYNNNKKSHYEFMPKMEEERW
jgi:hypothetical protein